MSKLKIKCNTHTFGTDVTLQNEAGDFIVKVAENMPFDPLVNLVYKKIKNAYQFRSPNIKIDDWPEMLKTLKSISGRFNIAVERDLTKNNRTDNIDETFTAWIWLEEKLDAAMFAWSNVDKWQKWSDALEAEDRADAKARKKPTKIMIDKKTGKITVKVTVKTLGPITP